VEKLTFSEIAKRYGICTTRAAQAYHSSVRRRKRRYDTWYGLPERAKNILLTHGFVDRTQIVDLWKSGKLVETLRQFNGCGDKTILAVSVWCSNPRPPGLSQTTE